jgi:uncharacterized membrane protein
MAEEDSEKKSTTNRMDKRKNDVKGLEQAQKEKMIIKGAVGLFIVIIILALVLRFAGPENTSDYSTPYEIIGDNLVFPTSQVSTSAKYYQYESNGKDVKFFAVKGSDGQIHTAFDACDVCFDQEKGYEQQGSQMMCRNCGNKYSTNAIGTSNKSGGCWPGYMERLIEGNDVVISLSELERGRGRYFP